ncbi:MAG TPA: TetR/AcrR family transcriptional regulator [Kineosporiaceae bacterium]|nr:TetR/AcrR family transcriptional regulator [Kineosporiaceae bacterium]
MSASAPAAEAGDRPARMSRRQWRRQQTREEILDTALRVMAEDGVGALNLSQVAARMGLHQSSLYAYFESRLAVYDALFERGMQRHLAVVRAAVSTAPPGWAAVRAAIVATVRFAVDDPVLAELLFSRAVPGFTPSPPAYAPSLQVEALMQTAVTAAVERGELHPNAASEAGLQLLIVLGAGVAAQQLANDPGRQFPEGRFTPLIGYALDMYEAYLAPDGNGLPVRSG